MVRILRPSLPNYIPTAEEAQLEWLINYKTQLPLLGPNYGLSEASIALALLAINGLIATLTMLKAIRDWLSQWVTVNEQQQYDKPKDSNIQVKWPEEPKWMTLPAPITVNAWQPILDTTKAFLANSTLSVQDKKTLKLEAYEPAKKRPISAETLDYPLITIVEENGAVVIRTRRGKKYRNIMAKYVIDYSNNGLYKDYGTAVDKDVRIPIVFPEGVTQMTWSIQAIYMKNGAELDKWCPPQSIVLRREGPVMEPATGAEQPAGLMEKSVNGVEVAA